VKEELHNFHFSPRIIRWPGHVAGVAKGNAYRILVGNPEGKRLKERPRCRRVDNMKMDFRETG
jgi:hypothetical protein